MAFWLWFVACTGQTGASLTDVGSDAANTQPVAGATSETGDTGS